MSAFTSELKDNAVENAYKYLMYMTVIHGARYWTPQKLNSLYKYACKSAGLEGYYDFDLKKQIARLLAGHISWCGRKSPSLDWACV